MNGSSLKNIYLTILTIITVVAIVLGSMYHVGGFFKKTGSFFSKKGSSGETVTETNDLDPDEIDKLEIDCGLMQVNIKEGGKFSVDFDGDERLKPNIKMSGKTLMIKQKDNNDISLPSLKDDTFLNITVPEGKEFDAITLDVGMGDVKIKNISAKDIDVDAAMGNVEGNDIVAGDIDIDAAMGNVEFYDAEFKNLDADASMGNITVESVNDLSRYDIAADASLGNIDIGGEKVSGSGEYNKNASSEKIGEIDVDCDMGNITLTNK